MLHITLDGEFFKAFSQRSWVRQRGSLVILLSNILCIRHSLKERKINYININKEVNNYIIKYYKDVNTKFRIPINKLEWSGI